MSDPAADTTTPPHGVAVAPAAPPPAPIARGSRAAKVAAVLAALTLLAVAYRTGIVEQLGEPERIAEALIELGAWGYLAFVLTYALLQPFGIPGTVFVVAAPLIWPWPVAFALSLTGTMAASVVGFSFARFVARDWVSKRIPQRFRKYDEALATRAFGTVFALRLVFWMPPLLHAFFGVSRVRFWTHVWGSLVGYLLPLFLLSFFGRQLFEALKGAPLEVWLGLGAALAVLALVVWQVRRARVSAASRARSDRLARTTRDP